MILEVVQTAKLVGDKVEAEDSILELLVVVELCAFVAAARQDRVEEEDGETADNEDRVLDEVDDKVDVEVGHRWPIGELAHVLIFSPPIFLIHDQVDSVPHDTTLDEPLDERPGREALVAARLREEAVAEEIVERIKNAQAKRHASHLGEEAQVDEQVVVEEVPEDEDERDGGEDDALLVLAFDVHLLGDQIDEVDAATYEPTSPEEQEDELKILDDVK